MSDKKLEEMNNEQKLTHIKEDNFKIEDLYQIGEKLELHRKEMLDLFKNKTISTEEEYEMLKKRLYNLLIHKMTNGVHVHKNMELFMKNIKEYYDIDNYTTYFLTRKGYLSFIYENLDHFHFFNEDVVYYMIKKHHEFKVKGKIGFLNHVIKGKLNSRIANLMISLGFIEDLVENINLFNGLENNVASNLIKSGYGKIFLDNLERFDLNRTTNSFIGNLSIVKLLSKDVNLIGLLMEKIDNFNLDYDEELRIINLNPKDLIKHGGGLDVIIDIERYPLFNIDKNTIHDILKAPCDDSYFISFFDKYLEKIKELKLSGDLYNLLVGGVLSKMIQKNFYNKVIDNLEKVNEFHSSIANNLVYNDQIEIFINNIQRFKKLDLYIGKLLIEKGESDIVDQNLNCFLKKDILEIKNYNNFYTKNLEQKLIQKESNKGNIILICKKFIEDKEFLKIPFNKLTTDQYNEIAIDLIKNNQLDLVGETIGNYKGLKKNLAKVLLATKRRDLFVDNIDCFNDLDNEIAHLLIQDEYDLNSKSIINYTRAVGEYIDKFSQLDNTINIKLNGLL